MKSNRTLAGLSAGVTLGHSSVGVLLRRAAVVALAAASVVPTGACAASVVGGRQMQSGADSVVTNVTLPRYPSISADGKTVAFSWRGDIWTVPTTGGLANRLTTNAYDDLYSAFSPDGKRLAFTSARNGASNIFTMSLDGTDLKQVTFSDRPFLLTQWGKNEKGEEKLFTAAVLEPAAFSGAQGWEVSPEGGDIKPITAAGGTTPVASPDGKRVLLTRGVSPWSRRGYHGSQNRDVWIYDRAAKSFTQVTKYDGNDGRARWLDDSTMVFVSDRVGNTLNLFSLKVGDGDDKAVQLTHFEGAGVDDFDVSTETGSIVFARWDKLYTMSAKGGTAAAGAAGEPTTIKVRGNEEEGDRLRFQSVAATVSESSLSPDGKTLAMVSYGEIYVRGLDSKSPTRRVSLGLDGRKRDISWSADGQRLFFVGDASGKDELYEATVKTTRSELRKKLGAPATSRPSDDDEGGSGGPAGAATQPATQPGTMPPITPEGEEGQEQFAGGRRGAPPGAPGAPGATAGGGTTPPSASASGGELSRWGDALRFDVKKMWEAKKGERSPTSSPDGKTFSYQRAGAVAGWELVLRDEASKAEHVVAKNFDSFDFRWSPDSKYVAYATEDRNNNSDIWIIPADGSEKPVNITRHPNVDGSPRWSADGKILAFLSNRTGTGDEMAAYAVYLDKDIEQMAQPELDAYFKDATAAARRRQPAATRPSTMPAVPGMSAATRMLGRMGSSTQPTTDATSQPSEGASPRRRRGPATTQSTKGTLKMADLQDAYLRVRRLTNVRGSVSDLELSPAGDRIYFVGYLGATRALLTQTRDATEPTRVAGAVSLQNLSLAGDSVAVVEGSARGGRAAVVKLPGGDTEYYDPADRLEVNLEKLTRQKFLETSRIMGMQFYDPKMNGVDWAKNTETYLPLALAARTSDEFDFVAEKFIGELNASHLGIGSTSTASPLAQSVGRLGVKVERVEKGMKITDVTPEGPADRGTMSLKTGDIITAIDFDSVGKRTLEEALLGRSGTEVVVTVERGGASVDVLITPVGIDVLQGLAYNRWRIETAKKVAELSGGRIGYIHIQGMNQASLETYKRDLYAACDGKEAMLIDVRWNGGGSTADLLLSSIMAPNHAYTVPRGSAVEKDSYPTDRLYIPRFVGPIDMLCNERSFSNAEIISHAFKTLKRGNLVGNTTAGGVISTGGATLLDGTSVRTPGRGWYTPDGTNMELHGAEPDVKVVQTPEDEVGGEDRQLKAAVDDVLKRLK